MIEALAAAGAGADKGEAREAFRQLQERLGAGDVRAAEPDAASPTGWRVNTLGQAGHPARLPLRRPPRHVDGAAGRSTTRTRCRSSGPGAHAGVRIVPGGSSVREGAYLGKGVICMPPMYINIGAYVGDGTLVDSHALVGSCAQIGARVHLSAGAQIGGVIEPVGAMPVVVEDDALVGGNTGIYEGAVVKRRAVIAAGTVLTGSTPIYDLPNGRIIKPEPGQPLVVPEGAVVVPGRAIGHRRRRQGLGPVAGHARDRQVPRRQDRHPHGARAVDPVDSSAWRARSSTSSRRPGRKARWRACWPATCAVAATRCSSSRSIATASTSSPRSGEPELVFSTHFDCVPPFFPSRVEDGVLHGRGACDAKGILAAQVAAAERLRAAGETRIGLVFVAGEERGSDGAKAANTIASQSRYLDQRRADRAEARPRDARRASACGSTARGKAAHSGYPELGESAIEKLLDVLHDLRGGDWPDDRCWAARTTPWASSAAAWRPTSSRRRPRPRCSSAPSAPTTRCARALAAVVAGRVEVAGDPGAARSAAAHRARLRHRGLRLLQRRAVPVQLGHAAAARSRHHPRRAHRPRAGRRSPTSSAPWTSTPTWRPACSAASTAPVWHRWRRCQRRARSDARDPAAQACRRTNAIASDWHELVPAVPDPESAAARAR